ncbi:MAG: hypothetical protein M3N08_04375 [Pseudomonadota bacterium]|nr:hypothetical protein [Pseudomonadota bacterium]
MSWFQKKLFKAVSLALFLLLACPYVANAQSVDDDDRQLDEQQLNAFAREAGNANLTELQRQGLATRVHSFSNTVAQRQDTEGDLLQRAQQLEAEVSSGAVVRSGNPAPPAPEPLSQTENMIVLGVAIVLDLLIVRRPFMSWYRRQRLFISGKNSVDILGKHIGNRLTFEAFIFILSFALVFFLAVYLKAMFHKG